jgi:RimJ/RimL family protein N-acetyltransferase
VRRLRRKDARPAGCPPRAAAAGRGRGVDRYRLETRRLLLVPAPPDLFEVAAADRGSAEAAVGAALLPDWPDPGVAKALRWLARIEDGWGVWLVVARDEGVVVGTAGFKGPPTDRHTVETGYGIEPAYRNRGFASEALTALVRWALGRNGVACVVAECERENAASIRVLEKVGFRRVGERGSMLDWAIESSEQG